MRSTLRCWKLKTLRLTRSSESPSRAWMILSDSTGNEVRKGKRK